MKIRNTQVDSKKVIPFRFRDLETDTFYFACCFEKTGMVAIFKTNSKIIVSDSITIDRWMSLDRFEKNIESGYFIPLTYPNGEIVSYGNKEFEEVLTRYASLFPMVSECL